MSTHKRKKKRSPVGAIVVMVLLLAVIAGSIFGALRFRAQYRELKAEKEESIALAEEELAAARAELASLDLSGPEGSQVLLDAREEALEKAADSYGGLTKPLFPLPRFKKEVENGYTVCFAEQCPLKEK